MELVESILGTPSVRSQCRLLSVNRSGYYYQACPESPENLRLMRRIDQLHLRHPVYGSPRLTAELRREGWEVNAKRVVRSKLERLCEQSWNDEGDAMFYLRGGVAEAHRVFASAEDRALRGRNLSAVGSLTNGRPGCASGAARQALPRSVSMR